MEHLEFDGPVIDGRKIGLLEMVEQTVFGSPFSIETSNVTSGISKLALTNFRAFRGTHTFDFEGKNILIYGENGSGKTSLWSAIDLFLAASLTKNEAVSRADFEKHQYQHSEEAGQVEMIFTEAEKETLPFVWSANASPWANEAIFPSAKLRACLDYRALWETYFLHRQENQVDIWPLLIETLMPHIESAATGEPFEARWFVVNNLKQLPARLTESQNIVLKMGLSEFDAAFRLGLEEIKTTALEILEKLSPNLQFNWDIISPELAKVEGRKQWKIIPPQVIVRVRLNNQPLKNHHNLLNEARLSALALSIYLAAAKINAAQARSGFKILALDDVLIGLDMSNRMPVLDVLQTYFSDWQIFLFTYDRVWYELAKARLDGDRWKKFEFFASGDVPVWNEDLDGFDKAREYLQTARHFAGVSQPVPVAPDYRAAGVYARTAFEILLKRFFQKHRVPVAYQLEAKQMLGDLWPVMESLESDLTREGITARGPVLSESFRRDMAIYTRNSLNPLCHSGFFQCERREVEKAVAAIETLQSELGKAHGKVAPKLEVPAPVVNFEVKSLTDSQLMAVKSDITSEQKARTGQSRQRIETNT